MKKVPTLCLSVALGAIVSNSLPQVRGASLGYPLTAGAISAQAGRSSITGTVFVESHRPIPDIWVELLDDFNSSLSRSKTDGSGRFAFNNLINGNYRVRVLPYGTDYQEQTIEVSLVSVSAVPGRPGADRQNLDIFLKLNNRAPTGPFAVGPGVVFVQEVPATAQKLYEEGLRFLREKNEKEGLARLKRALEIFPNYYLALDRLGGEYAIRGHKDRSYWEAGLVLLEKAVEVNPRGVNSRFGLGWIQFQLGLNTQAIATLEQASALYGKGADTFLWLGRAYWRASALDKAEAAFKRANEITNGKVADIHWQLANLYSEQKRYREAADELELYLKTQLDASDDARIEQLIRQLRAKAEGGNRLLPS